MKFLYAALIALVLASPTYGFECLHKKTQVVNGTPVVQNQVEDNFPGFLLVTLAVVAGGAAFAKQQHERFTKSK